MWGRVGGATNIIMEGDIYCRLLGYGSLRRVVGTGKSGQFDTWAAKNGGINSETHVSQKPVVILPGADHSDFCPGFEVPGDIYPSEITKDHAMSIIGEQVGAFLNVQAGVNTSSSIKTLQAGQAYTRDELLKPMVSAFDITGERSVADDGKAPWCEIAQKKISGVKSNFYRK